MVTGLFAGQHNTKLHGTITGVIYSSKGEVKHTVGILLYTNIIWDSVYI